MSNPYCSNSVWGSPPNHRGIGLSNTVHSEVAPCLPLPSLPVCFGASDPELRLGDETTAGFVGGNSWSLNRREVVAQSNRIAGMLSDTDVSYLNLKEDVKSVPYGYVEPLQLYEEVLRCNPQAFEHTATGHGKGQISCTMVPERKSSESSVPVGNQMRKEYAGSFNHEPDSVIANANDISVSSSKRPKVKKKGNDVVMSSVRPDPIDVQEVTIGSFCDVLEDICGRAEITSDDHEEAEWSSLPVADIRILVNEVSSMRAKKLLQLVPVSILARLLRVLDQQIHRAEGLSVEDCERSDSDAVSLVFCALEAIHCALAMMAYNEMPKELYKEEIIERILEFTKYQINDIMSAYDPLYRALHKPSDNGAIGVDEDEDADGEFSSSSKKRRTNKSVKVKKSTFNKVSAAAHSVLQKLCTILGLIKDLLLIERLADSCILQLLKTSFTTFLVDNIQLLQLKAIDLISGIFYSYRQQRNYVIDEIIQLLWKLPSSRRAIRAYHLPDEEQRQIQMISALLIQMIHSSADLPGALRQESTSNSVLEVSVDTSCITKCHEAVTEACCLFWTRVLQRLTTVKAQDTQELKVMIENLVMDLLTTLNLPEYPASAPLLEVLCVLLLQNAGLKSKDVAARSMAIDILGTIGARLKNDAVRFQRDESWILRELVDDAIVDPNNCIDKCIICLDGRVEKTLFICQGCQRLFHADCVGTRAHEVPSHSWFCQFCLCKKQLLVLQSFCRSQCKVDGEKNHSQSGQLSESAVPITKVEIIQQILLNYLQDVSSTDDLHLFIRWFYLCLWYKDDPMSQQKYAYYLARLRSRAIVRDTGIVSAWLTRDVIKKITLALGQNNSFSRGFDKILHMLLASLKENSPVIRAKALRAVSIIVEADPEVLCDKRVQLAVEGRFCDSAISVREAALELVGRHIASHPDVGMKYYEKVAERIKDTGVSVRKRAIRIIRDMCTSNANFSEFTSACMEMISRVSDDESSVQDLVCKTFYEFWFEESSVSHTQYFGDGSSVPLEVAKKTEQIADVLRRLSNQQPLVSVIKRNLALDFFSSSAKAAGINPASLASVRKRCELMCKCLLEKILQVGEMNGEEVEVCTLPYVLVLHAFCVVDPTLCAPSSDPSQFVVTLQPYLKTQVDNKVGAQLLESIIFIVDAVLPMLPKLPHNVAEELEQDLKQMIARHSFLTVVHACIKCLCSLSKVAGKGAVVVEHLIQMFFKYLDSQGADNKQRVSRFLFCLGLLVRYGNSLLSTANSRRIDVASSLRLFKRYLLTDDFGLKIRSLQALGYVLIARPDFMLEEDIKKILEATLSSGSEDRIKMQALQNMYEYLLDAESQLGTDQAGNNVVHNSVDGGQTVPVAAGAGDTNICGGIVQLYWDTILGRCVDPKGQVRESALKIVEVALRQGLVHPITCVPYLIALETDPLEGNSKLAHHLLMSMHEKYPSFFESRLGDGLQMSFAFMQSISGSSAASQNSKGQQRHSGNVKGKSDCSLAQAKFGVARIYKLIRGNRASRNKFISSIVRKFDTPSLTDTVVPFLMYCTEILALLPFIMPDEPLYLVYTINRIIQVRAGVLEANLKHLLHPSDAQQVPQVTMAMGQPIVSHMNAMDLNETLQPVLPAQSIYIRAMDLNGTSQQDTINNTDVYPSTTLAAKVHAIDNEESGEFSQDVLQKFQADCLAATALQLLLKLKRHLKIVYGLNDARCQAFSPNEPQKPGEFLTKQNIPFDISETRCSLPTTRPEFVQRYQEFKTALKEDTVDYAIYTANIKRKRPTPRKGAKSGRAITGDGDDEDFEDVWSGGYQRPSNGRRGSSSRARQRF